MLLRSKECDYCSSHDTERVNCRNRRVLLDEFKIRKEIQRN